MRLADKHLGSSPQVRGRPGVRGAVPADLGLIPAGAGQTVSVTAPVGVKKGSSPQVRGKLLRRLRHDLDVGLIPAGAGQTGQSRAGCQTARAHPRRCGADLLSCLTPHGSPTAHPRRCGADSQGREQERREAGSSPQVRGRPRGCFSSLLPLGLIPSGAGQTAPRASYSPAVGAHPRRCGADHIERVKVPRFLGSSPQVRGRP